MTEPGYPATPLLRRLTAAHGWQHDLACDARGETGGHGGRAHRPDVDRLVAIAGKNQTLAIRHRTNDDRLILPIKLPSESRAVWRRHDRCEDVLTELCELPFEPDQGAK